MSPDEAIALVVSLVVSVIAWGKWLIPCFTVRDFHRSTPLRVGAVVAPVVAFSFLFWILRNYASANVKNDGLYIFFYLCLGTTWLGCVMYLSGFCGLSFRDDWIERRNPAAAAVGAGGLFGGMCAFAGGNIGNGPGWWVVIFCALLATGTLFTAWLLYDRLSGAMEQVTIERNQDAGLRLGGFLILTGIITGRAVAGDWHSASATLLDFSKLAWPLLPYVIGAGIIENSLLRSDRRNLRLALAAVVAHGTMAVLYLYWAGPWN